MACQPVALLAWLRDNEPENYKNIKYIFECKDYVRFRLTGEALAEITDYSGANVMNLHTRQYDDELLRLFGLEDIKDALPPLVRATDLCGTVTAEAALLTGLEEGTAGASLKQAQTAEEILTFAADKQIWNLDAYARTAAITEAWSGLSDEEKALAKRNFDGVAGMIDKVFKDYESVRGTFEDAGVGEEMKALSVNVYARRSFNALRDLVAELQ